MSEETLAPYYLYSGTGNTFVLIDARSAALSDHAAVARKLCEAENVDGLLVMENSEVADIRMRIINRDGSEAEMCGNGSRCAVYWAHHEAGFPQSFTMQSGAGILDAEITKDVAKVRLTDPDDAKYIEELKGITEGPHYLIDTGVPHLVTEVGDIAVLDVESIGKEIRYHNDLKPRGANASFYQVRPGGIDVRVYERGVEGETMACGTGSAACALIASMRNKLSSPIEVTVKSGETLNIYFETVGERSFKNVYLEGAVRPLGKKG